MCIRDRRSLGRLRARLRGKFPPALRDACKAARSPILERDDGPEASQRGAGALRLLEADPRLTRRPRREDHLSRVNRDRQGPADRREPRPSSAAPADTSGEAPAQPRQSVLPKYERRRAGVGLGARLRWRQLH